MGDNWIAFELSCAVTLWLCINTHRAAVCSSAYLFVSRGCACPSASLYIGPMPSALAWLYADPVSCGGLLLSRGCAWYAVLFAHKPYLLCCAKALFYRGSVPGTLCKLLVMVILILARCLHHRTLFQAGVTIEMKAQSMPPCLLEPIASEGGLSSLKVRLLL